MKIDAARAQTVFLCLGTLLLAAALFLPSVEGYYYRQPSILPGWLAMLLALAAGAGALGDLFARAEGVHPLYLLPFLAALLNLNFIVTGICLYRRRRRGAKGGLPRWLVASTLCGLILAIVSPFALQGSETVRPGFYVWLLAHACLLGSVVSARAAHHLTDR